MLSNILSEMMAHLGALNFSFIVHAVLSEIVFTIVVTNIITITAVRMQRCSALKDVVIMSCKNRYGSFII